MTPLRGRSLCGERLPADAPFGKWQTRTELCWNLGDEADQAALCGFNSMTSIPSCSLHLR